MTGPTRGSRARRGGRRPGWLLLTVLLVLAIGASSALVFTNRVELLKLAVILALWAAVVAAFVSVIYRRQSDADQAKARDLKTVYDLQLDREISARREYELAVESHLRRELASEFRAEAADEVAALRAELAALRSNLEILFDADLSHRPALETDRTTVHAYSDWDRIDENMAPDRVSSSRISPVERDDSEIHTAESPIIDVPEEPQVPEPDWVAPMYGGAHRRPSEAAPTPEERRVWAAEPIREPTPEPATPPRQASPVYRPEPVAYTPPPATPPPATPPPATPPPPAQPPPRPAPQPVSRVEPEPERVGRHGPRQEWTPVQEEGQWVPPGEPGSNWVSPSTLPAPENGFSTGYRGGRRAAGSEPTPPAAATPGPEPHRGRHWVPPESGSERADSAAAAPPVRHSSPGQGPVPAAPHTPPPQPTPPVQQAPQPAPRHRTDEQAAADSENTGGQSVADLMARLRVGTAEGGGGRRRRRED
jgi:hypothetical protein